MSPNRFPPSATPTRHGLVVDGKTRDAQDGATLATLNPCTGTVLAEIADGSAGDVDAAVTAARRALDGPWGRMAAADRGRLLRRWSQLVEQHAETLAAIDAADTGKPLSTARRDVRTTARYFDFYGSAADKVHGHVLPYYPGHAATVLREPLGVTAHIVPWNYPGSQFARTVAPALAVGNSCVVKPSEEACLGVLALGTLASDAELPAGALNIVTGRGVTAGAALAAHPGIDYMSFTGSPASGALVAQAAARHHVPCTLELGGKSPQIVFPDADLDRAIPAIVRAIVQHAGQTCSAGSRLLVHRDVYDEVAARVTAAFDALRAGTPDMDLDCGPVMNARQRSAVVAALDEAKRDDIALLARGRLVEGLPEGGFWIAPALLGNVPRGHRLEQEEIFGPVLSIQRFADEADAIALANGTAYGLVAGLWTDSGSRQQRVARALRCGQVFINCFWGPSGIELPFGGVGKSGHGREKGLVALEHVSTTKTLVQSFE